MNVSPSEPAYGQRVSPGSIRMKLPSVTGTSSMLTTE
jgi:hypothetical protein